METVTIVQHSVQLRKTRIYNLKKTHSQINPDPIPLNTNRDKQDETLKSQATQYAKQMYLTKRMTAMYC